MAVASSSRQRKRSNELWRVAGLVGCAVVFASLALWRGPASEAHEAILMDLRALEFDHASLQRDVLKARAGLLRNYDPLVNSVVRLHRSVTDLASLVGEANTNSEQELKNISHELSLAVDRLEGSVEEFKTRNALFQNSMGIFSQTLPTIHERASAATDGVLQQADEIGNLMLLFFTDPQPTLVQKISARLKGLSADGGTFPEIALLTTHGRMVLVTMPTVDDAVTAVQASDLPSKATDFTRIYLEAYNRASAGSTWARVFLGSVSVLLCGYIGLLFHRLRAQRNALSKRLDFEKTVNSVKAVLLRPSAPGISPLMTEALALLAAFFGAKQALLSLVDRVEFSVEQSFVTEEADGRSLNEPTEQFFKCLRAAKDAEAEASNVFFRDFRPKDHWSCGQTAPGAICIGAIMSSRYAALLVLEYQTKLEISPEDISQLGAAVELLGRSFELHNNEIEREALEQRLEHSQRLEAVGTLAGGIAHEFNNILGAMLGYGEMALGLLKRPSSTRQYVQQIVASGERAQHIVDQILTFSRKRERTIKSFSLAEAVEAAIPLARMFAPASDSILFSTPHRSSTVLAHPIEIQQIILNLCRNSFDAGASSVRIEIDDLACPRNKVLAHGELPAGHYVKLSVEDDGSGISENVLPHLFEPFFTTKSGQGGTGLGLATVHGHVSAFSGAIDVKSRPKLGTHFDIYLPASRECPVALDQFFIEQHDHFGNGETIALVDTNPDQRMMYEEKLAALGYEAFSFPTAEVLSTWIEKNVKPDLIILDAASLEKSAADRLNRGNERAEIPVIYILDRDQAQHVQGDQFLFKPVSTKTLSYALRSQLSHHHSSGSR
jgi:signal transduction histidine kinase